MAEMQLEQYILPLIISIVTALVTAWATVYLSLRRFRAERLWDRRLAAYQTVLEALHRISRYCAAEWEDQASPNPRKPTEDEQRKIREAYAEISRATDLGSFLLSVDAATCLKNLESSMDKADEEDEDYWANLSLVDSAVNACLKSLRVIAKEDLKKLSI